jgi:uncharacterized protein GlcG (DUF336 family)
LAQDEVTPPCVGLPTAEQLKAALKAARAEANGGFNLDMWATMVDRDGVVCAVVYTGRTRGDQWPGSRVISAQKAYAANAFSLPTLALSTANLYSAVQPGGTLYGLADSNPVNVAMAYRGDPAKAGTTGDTMIGERVGGINTFGGGLALYSQSRGLIGGIGVSGDSSCADHNIAWRTRRTLELDFVPAGVSGDASRPDNIVYDISEGNGQTVGQGAQGASASGWGHPKCSQAATSVSTSLPTKR